MLELGEAKRNVSDQEARAAVTRAEWATAVHSARTVALAGVAALLFGLGLRWLIAHGLDPAGLPGATGRLSVLSAAATVVGLIAAGGGAARWFQLIRAGVEGDQRQLWFALAPGRPAELCIAYRRGVAAGEWRDVRILERGLELLSVPVLGGCEPGEDVRREVFSITTQPSSTTADWSFELPDGRLLRLQVVPDFWRQRRVQVSLAGVVLRPSVGPLLAA
ncbi:MAG: hypothetical protein QM767_18170 [Anaeromyxobacter sp.]